jgi:hypothetical protein
MALTPQKAQEKYAENMYRIYRKWEEKIDAIILERFGSIEEHNKLLLYTDEIWKEKIQDEDINSLMSLVKSRYSDWNIEINEEERFLVFNYVQKNTSFLQMYNMAERFENLDIPDNNIDAPAPDDVEIDW